MQALRRHRLTTAVHVSLLLLLPGLAAAQDATPPETPAATLPAMGTKSREHLYGTSVRITHPAHIQDRMER